MFLRQYFAIIHNLLHYFKTIYLIIWSHQHMFSKLIHTYRFIYFMFWLAILWRMSWLLSMWLTCKIRQLHQYIILKFWFFITTSCSYVVSRSCIFAVVKELNQTHIENKNPCLIPKTKKIKGIFNSYIILFVCLIHVI